MLAGFAGSPTVLAEKYGCALMSQFQKTAFVRAFECMFYAFTSTTTSREGPKNGQSINAEVCVEFAMLENNFEPHKFSRQRRRSQLPIVEIIAVQAPCFF